MTTLKTSVPPSGAASSPDALAPVTADDGCALAPGVPELPCDIPSYGDYLRVLGGRGTTCLPMASAADVPMPSEDIRDMWNQVVQQSTQQTQKQVCNQQALDDREKSKKLEKLLTLALHSGNMELAMLLFSSLETRQANAMSKSLLSRMQDLQSQKSQYTDQMAALGTQNPDDAKKANDLNAKIGDVGTEMQMLQTFLQDVTSEKNQAEEMASSFLKGESDLGMSIARNIA